jgi:ADP-ribose pyrophosphatase
LLKKNSKIWKVLKKDKVFEAKPWISIYSKKIKLPNNKVVEKYHEIKLIDYVIIYALTKNNKLVVEKQYKPAIEGFAFTLPKGAIEKGETSLSAAKREFLEETGYKAKNWKKIGSVVGSGSYGCGTAHIYLAKEAYKFSNPSSDDLEITKILLLKPDIFYSKMFKQKLGLMASWSAIGMVLILKKLKNIV